MGRVQDDSKSPPDSLETATRQEVQTTNGDIVNIVTLSQVRRSLSFMGARRPQYYH